MANQFIRVTGRDSKTDIVINLANVTSIIKEEKHVDPRAAIYYNTGPGVGVTTAETFDEVMKLVESATSQPIFGS